MSDLSKITSRYIRGRGSMPNKGKPLERNNLMLGMEGALGMPSQRQGNGASGAMMPNMAKMFGMMQQEDEIDPLMQYANILSRYRPRLTGQPMNPLARMY